MAHEQRCTRLENVHQPRGREPGKSFFRYRDPDTHEIITSKDNEWNVRIFEIRSDKLLWHAVYSDTNRFSLGYMIYPRDFRVSISQTFKRLLKI